MDQDIRHASYETEDGTHRTYCGAVTGLWLLHDKRDSSGVGCAECLEKIGATNGRDASVVGVKKPGVDLRSPQRLS